MRLSNAERERLLHYSQASAETMQAREAEHLAAPLKDAIDAVYDLKTALIKLGEVTGDSPLDWGPRPRLDVRTILDWLIKDLEGE